MAFRKITEGDMLGKGNVGRPDTPGVSTAEMQRIMDELPREVLAPAFNELAGQLEAETAAADIGAAAPEGVTAAPAGKLQAVLNGLRDLVKAHTDRADNPHGVTAAQAGAYSKAETDAAIGGLRRRGAGWFLWPECRLNGWGLCRRDLLLWRGLKWCGFRGWFRVLSDNLRGR